MATGNFCLKSNVLREKSLFQTFYAFELLYSIPTKQQLLHNLQHQIWQSEC